MTIDRNIATFVKQHQQLIRDQNDVSNEQTFI